MDAVKKDLEQGQLYWNHVNLRESTQENQRNLDFAISKLWT